MVVENGAAGEVNAAYETEPQTYRDIDTSAPKYRCGYFGWSPDWLQVFNKPRWALLCICWFCLIHGFLVNGINNVNTTSIERRYNLASSEVALISSIYDISAGIFVLPVTFFGTFGHQPRFLSLSAVAMVLGTFVMVIPHMASGTYMLGKGTVYSCVINGTDYCTENDQDSSLSSYLYVFLVGQFLNGIGGTTLYTLGIVYIDSHVEKKKTPIYHGLMFAAASLGPAIGYIVGGIFLGYYVDIDKMDTSTISISIHDARWVGAWWIGFVIGCFLLTTVVLFLLPYPKIMPAGVTAQEGDTSEVHQDGSEDIVSKEGFFTNIRDIPTATKLLLRNPVLVFCTVATCFEGIAITGYGTFLPKYIYNQYGQSPKWSALIAGFLAISGTVSGHIVQGFITKCFNLGVSGLLRFCAAMCLLTCCFAVVLLASCSPLSMAGVHVPYHDQMAADIASSADLLSSCNIDCGCTLKSYAPVCGSDQLTYFSPCHAGCLAFNKTVGFTTCACICGSTQTATLGTCVPKVDCKYLWLFIPIFFIVIFTASLSYVPSLTISLRCIPEKQRVFGIGIQSVFSRFLGTFLGPILFGAVFDEACMVWQDNCGDKGSCWVYNNSRLGLHLLFLTIGTKFMSGVFFGLADFFYKPPKASANNIINRDELKGHENQIALEAPSSVKD